MEDSVHQHRPLLFSLAYNILGDTQEAEDIVQDAFVTWFSKEQDVEYPKAYLSKIVVNRSIDRLEALKKQRDLYKGTWLPVPLVTQEAVKSDDLKDNLPYAMLSTLEKLNPVERAVFILREAFNHSYTEIAALCNIAEDHARQLQHRAHEKIQNPKRRFDSNEEKQQQLLEAFLQACLQEDTTSLMKILKDDVILYSDGGGKVSASLVPIYGPDMILKFLLAVLQKTRGTIDIKFVRVNGAPGALLINKDSGKTDTIFTLSSDGDRITDLFLVRNPDKIFF